MLSSDSMRGYNDAFILSILLQEPSYGYEISKQISKISQNNYLIKETTLYSAFNRLEKNKFIESFPGQVTHGKKRTYYGITSNGEKYLQEKIKEWHLTKKVVDSFISKGDEDIYESD